MVWKCNDEEYLCVMGVADKAWNLEKSSEKECDMKE